MHLFFLDESSKATDTLFGLGGVAIQASDWDDLNLLWDRTLAANRWPEDVEPKWHGIRSGEVPEAMADGLYAAIAEAPVTCFGVILRPEEGRKLYPEQFATEDDVFATALTFACERFQRFLAREDSYGVIVVDSRWRDADDRLRVFFERLQEQGTPYLKIERIVDGLMMGPSHHSLGLMVADLVIGTTLGAERGQDDARRWFEQLRPRFARHPDSGEIEGVGLKYFPPHESDPRPPADHLFDLEVGPD